MKTAKLDALKPSRADYRLIYKVLESSYAGQVLHTEDAYAVIVKVFQRAGGRGNGCSWGLRTIWGC